VRHSFTSSLANAGVAPELRMKLAGHASERVHRGYSHHDMEALRAVMAKLPSLNSSNSRRRDWQPEIRQRRRTNMTSDMINPVLARVLSKSTIPMDYEVLATHNRLIGDDPIKHATKGRNIYHDRLNPKTNNSAGKNIHRKRQDPEPRRVRGALGISPRLQGLPRCSILVMCVRIFTEPKEQTRFCLCPGERTWVLCPLKS
jgi:hypothetical protein